MAETVAFFKVFWFSSSIGWTIRGKSCHTTTAGPSPTSCAGWQACGLA